MIKYTRLWDLMKEKHYTKYTLRVIYGISNSTVERLRDDMHVSTYTLDRLCKILDCRIEDIAEYVPDDIEEKSKN